MAKYKINLLSAKKEKSVERLVYFSLHYLRYILVITQIVVIGVFLYKFRVDQKIIDLSELANQRKEIVTVSQPLVKEARGANFAIEQARLILEEQNKLNLILPYLFSRFPKDLSLKRLEISSDTTSMSGVTQNVDILKSFYSRLKKDAKFKKVALSNISRTDQGLEFTFELKDFAVSAK